MFIFNVDILMMLPAATSPVVGGQFGMNTIANDDIIDYGKLVNIRPHVIPNHNKYIAWSDVVPLGSPECSLLGPVDFQAGRRNLDHSVWSQLFHICATQGIIPPTLYLQPMIWSTSHSAKLVSTESVCGCNRCIVWYSKSARYAPQTN